MKHTSRWEDLSFPVDLIDEVPEDTSTNPVVERLKQGAGKILNQTICLCSSYQQYGSSPKQLYHYC